MANGCRSRSRSSHCAHGGGGGGLVPGHRRSAYGIAAPQARRSGTGRPGQPVRVEGGCPGARAVRFGADLRSQRPAGPLVAFGGGHGLAPLLMDIHLGRGHRAGGDLHGSLQPVAHGVLERVGVVSAVIDAASVRSGSRRPARECPARPRAGAAAAWAELAYGDAGRPAGNPVRRPGGRQPGRHRQAAPGTGLRTRQVRPPRGRGRGALGLAGRWNMTLARRIAVSWPGRWSSAGAGTGTGPAPWRRPAGAVRRGRRSPLPVPGGAEAQRVADISGRDRGVVRGVDAGVADTQPRSCARPRRAGWCRAGRVIRRAGGGTVR